MLMEGLRVFPDRIRRNLDLSDGLIMAEALMLSLGNHIGRQKAHDVVYEAAQTAARERKSFRDLLAEDEEISRHLNGEQIAAMLDTAPYTGTGAQFAAVQAEVGRASCRERVWQYV